MSLSQEAIETKINNIEPKLGPIIESTACRETVRLWLGRVDESLPPAFELIIKEQAYQGRYFASQDGPVHPDIVKELNHLSFEMAKDGPYELLRRLHNDTAEELKKIKLARLSTKASLLSGFMKIDSKKVGQIAKRNQIIENAENFLNNFFGIRQAQEPGAEIKRS